MSYNVGQAKVLVISGVGMTEGGILSVLRNVLNASEDELDASWTIVALVNNKELFENKRVKFLSFPKVKKSWLRRIYFELVSSWYISKKINASVWLSLHDMTSITAAPKQYVYAHNPSSFVKPTFRDLYFDPIFFIHSLVYKYVYALNINRNNNVFVQQGWIKSEFEKRYSITNVKISRPYASLLENNATSSNNKEKHIKRWLYPTFPRHFKNIEILCEAMHILSMKRNIDICISITISGDENRYAKWIYNRFSKVPGVNFIGLQKPKEIERRYMEADGVIFPSLLETWGLPLSEAKERGLKILAANLPYAHETIGKYSNAIFFEPTDPASLAAILEKLSNGDFEHEKSLGKYSSVETENELQGWNELVKFICADSEVK